LFKGFERAKKAQKGLARDSFMASHFVGRPDFSLLFPPEKSPEYKAS
jgi:hypothetical protein